MSDESTQATPDSGQQNSGVKPVPFFSKTGHPSPLSISDMNVLVARVNALSNLKVIRIPADPLPDGTIENTAYVLLSAENQVITLNDALTSSSGGGGSGTANIVPMQVQSFTIGNDYLSAKFGAFVGTSFTATGAAINVALPWELRSAQRPGSAIITPAYAVNDIIFALSTSGGNNGVVVSSAELLWMDLGLGRAWQAAPLQAQDFTITDVTHNNVIMATNNLTGATGITIAKPFKLRNNIASATIDGVSWSYSYTSSIQRTATSTGYSSYQRVSPRYLVGDIIWADQPVNTQLSGVTWMDQNRDGRSWADKVDQTTP